MSKKNIRLKDNEKIIGIVRSYGLTYFWPIVLVLFLVSVPFFFMFWLFNHSWWGQTLFFIPVCIGFLLLFRTLFIWRSNNTIITTHRIFDVDQRSFFERHVSEVYYDKVEDVVVQTKGFWQTILGYGSLTIEVGDGSVQIILNRIKRPTYIQGLVNELRDRYVSRHAQYFSGDVAGAIVEKLYELGLEELMRVEEVLKKRIKKIKTKLER